LAAAGEASVPVSALASRGATGFEQRIALA
jgi:hypothetical protein